MNTILRKYACAAMLGAMMTSPVLKAQVYTPGSVKLLTTINDMTSGSTYNGGDPVNGNSPTNHYAVAWVTKADGTFIKTVWRQGSATYTNSKWTGHFKTWTAARGSSIVTDGYTSATAADYTAAVNNPVTVTWNCQDASGALVPDGNYIFRVQYAEDAAEVDGPVTTALAWTKGSAPATVNPAAQGTLGMAPGSNNFTGMSIVWKPDAEIAVEYPTGTNLIDGTASIPFGRFNVDQPSSAFTFTVKNSGTAALTLTNPVGKDGTNSSDFTVSSIATSVAAAGSTTFTVTFKPSAVGARTAAIHIVSNDADESPFDITLTGTGASAYQDWIDSQVSSGQSGAMQTPYNDGVTNLEKFAFNMNAAGPDVRTLTMGGGVSETAGLPCGSRVGGTLRIEYLHRKDLTYPGISYTPQFSTNIGTWVNFMGSPVSVTSLNTTWERVVVDAPAVASGSRFGRVMITQP